MGLFGSLIGWDQLMGATNALMASYLIDKADCAKRINIAKEVAGMIMRVEHMPTIDAALERISN